MDETSYCVKLQRMAAQAYRRGALRDTKDRKAWQEIARLDYADMWKELERLLSDKMSQLTG